MIVCVIKFQYQQSSNPDRNVGLYCASYKGQKIELVVLVDDKKIFYKIKFKNRLSNVNFCDEILFHGCEVFVIKCYL